MALSDKTRISKRFRAYVCAMLVGALALSLAPQPNPTDERQSLIQILAPASQATTLQANRTGQRLELAKHRQTADSSFLVAPAGGIGGSPRFRVVAIEHVAYPATCMLSRQTGRSPPLQSLGV
jgi:hypothetical protein